MQFKRMLKTIGGSAIEVNELSTLIEKIQEKTANGLMVINTIPELGEVHGYLQFLSADTLADVDTAYIRGTIAVAENGAVWLNESQMMNRLLPFICQHLVVIIAKKNIAATMHQAYQLIDTAKDGFGVFITGPSKTADIEQSLVLDAHGPQTMTVVLVNEE